MRAAGDRRAFVELESVAKDWIAVTPRDDGVCPSRPDAGTEFHGITMNYAISMP
jgi:hypothetical protein